MGVGVGQHWMQRLHQPRFLPPLWLLAGAGLLLCCTTGVAAWLIWRRLGASRHLRLWGWLLAANAMASIAIFGVHSLRLALAMSLLALALAIIATRNFLRLRPLAGALLLPYLTATAYACGAIAAFWWLNPV